MGFLLALAGLVTIACRGSAQRSAPRAPVWEDDDRHPFEPPPEPFYSPYIWDGADNSFFRPLAHFWKFEAPREARNVNALDEVPDSSWFTNRIGRSGRLRDTPRDRLEALARGACTEGSEPVPPWTVSSGKPDGANPGFFITDARGQRYLMKTDGLVQPERPSAADTIAAAIYHLAGYFAPCNQVVFFDPAILRLEPDAEVKLTSGRVEPMTDAHVEQVLSKAAVAPDGRLRASVSRFIDARPISPWRYSGTRDGDPNDVIPHEHRRELRGMYVLAAWVDHVDSRQENTLAGWVSTDGGGYVRHYMLDFGDCFGQLAPWPPLSARLGHSGYLDFDDVFEDFVTLGLIDRPWYHAELGPAGKTLGYYDARRFVPDRWEPGYPNAAFIRHTEHDAAWMARIIARFTRPLIERLVDRAHFSDPIVPRELVRILRARQTAILERYLTRASPLTAPAIAPSNGGTELCVEDRAVTSGLRSAERRRYRATFSSEATPARAVEPRTHDGRVCVPIDPDDRADVEIVAWSPERDAPGPLRIRLDAVGGRLRVVELTRPLPKGAGR